MGKTDHNGEDIVALNWFDSLYRVKIYSDGVLELNVEPYKIGETPQIFYILSTQSLDILDFDDVEHTLYFNNDTNKFILIFEDSSDKISGGCLRVVKASAQNYTTLYDECVNSNTGTLTYDIGVNQTGTYLAVFYATGSPPHIIDTLMIVKQALDSIYNALGNLDATVLAMITVGTATMFGLLGGPVLGVIMMIAGLIISISLGFYNIELLAEVIGLSAVGIYIAYLIKK